MDVQEDESHGAGVKIGLPPIHASMYHHHIDGIKVGPYGNKVCKSLVLIFTRGAKFFRSKEDSQHISGLKDEITLLKAFIMESYNNLTELRRNESRAEMESEYQPNDSGYGDSSAAASYPQSDNDQNAESGSSSSDDEPGPLDADRETSMEAQRLTSQQGDNRRDPSREISKYSTQPPTPKNGPASRDAHRESNLLLQMVPYRPKLPGPIRSDRLLPAAPGQDGSKATTSKGPTESVRYLLDKWTVSGSTPISTILDEESSKEERKGEEEEEKGEASVYKICQTKALH